MVKRLGRSGAQTEKKGARILGHIGDQLAAESSVGTGRLEMLSLDMILLTDQVRTLGMTVEDIVKHAEKIQDLANVYTGEKLEKFQSLLGLAQSIKSHGLIEPVSVYEVRGGFELIAGERRFLAHLLLKKESIQAIVKPKPDDIALTIAQLIENIQRENLSLGEQVKALLTLKKSLEREGGSLDANYLQKQLGFSKTVAYRYITVCSADEEVFEAIETSSIQSLKVADEFARIQEPEARAGFIERLNSGRSLDEIKKDTLKAPKKKKTNTTRRGQPRKFVDLGRTSNPDLLKHLIGKCLSVKEFSDLTSRVDWDDFSSLTELWDNFIELMEKETGK